MSLRRLLIAFVILAPLVASFYAIVILRMGLK